MPKRIRSDKRRFGKDIRKVIQVGRSLAIVLPIEYVRANRIRLGDLIELEYYDREFHGRPVDIEKLADKFKSSEMR